MKFGFLAHPTSAGQRNAVRAAALAADLLAERTGSAPTRPPTAVDVPMLRGYTSPAGASCTGELRYLPYTAEQLLRHSATAARFVVDEVRRLADRGAAIVGLGGASSIVGDRGLWVADQVDTAVTSGNSLTAYSAYEVTRHVADRLGLDPAGGDERARITVIGYPGSIGLVLTKLLAADGYAVDVVHRRGARGGPALLRYLDPALRERVTLLADVDKAYRRGRLFVAASSSGGVVDPQRLRPGSVVVDVALPRDVAAPPAGRADVLVLDGGMVTSSAVPDGDGFPAPLRLLNGCLAETLVLALEGRAECFSLGRELDPARVLDIGALAARHGLLATPLASFGRTVADDELLRLRRHHEPAARTAARADVVPLERVTAQRFRRHVNPPLADFLTGQGLDNVFTAGRGCTLSTSDGTEYLDFVAGYGCLNLGHNPPAVVDRLRGFLDAGTPNFVQYVSMPVHTAELAERLCELAPGAPERVFFSNSGAEAVEAALKVARAATGRSRLVYVANSYHGKTLGALSVTGRATHRAPFGPLLADTVAVPFGDEAALAAALDGAAAFIVEPILGEGGVVLPPDGYLRRAQQLCRSAGAVFVVDEIQTGLGRTGALFASDHDGLEPDVLCLAKSLSGGLVPIGATLVTGPVWDAAYGSTSRCALHSSTFGGGNLAAAAGLATLDTLLHDDLAGHAARVGEHLRESLRAACAGSSFVAEVRGRGLMNAVSFDADLSGAAGAAVEDLLTRMPGDLHDVAAWLSDDARAALARAGRAVEEDLGNLLCLRVVRALAHGHRILTFVTANRSQVLRLQPPLVLTEAEADRFVAAMAAVTADLSIHSELAPRKEPHVPR